jgi:hypothetical protein
MSENKPTPTRRSFRLRAPSSRAVLSAVAIALLMAIPASAYAGSVVSGTVATATHGAPTATPAPAAASSPGASLLSLIEQLRANPSLTHLSASDVLASRALVANAASSTLSPRPATADGNTQLGAPCTSSSSITAINGTNSTLLAGLSSLEQAFNGSGGALCSTFAISGGLYAHGFLTAERSTDGGATWTQSWLPSNDSWKNTTASVTAGTNGATFGFYYPIGTAAFGLPFSSPSVTSANDGTTLLASQWSNPCSFVGNCTQAQDVGNDGIAVARSTNGGASWINTTVLGGAPFTENLTPSATCQAAGFGVGDYFLNFALPPSVAINPVSDVAVATWAFFHVIPDFSGTACTEFISSTVQVSTSANGGMSWTAPKNISSNLSFNPHVAIGPAPHDEITIVAQNWLNASQDSSTQAWGANWQTFTSSDNGSTWSTPTEIGSPGAVNLVSGTGASSPNSFWSGDTPFSRLAATIPSFAVDSNSTSPYVGNQYIAWSDNNTPGSSDQGVPAIDVEYRTATGGWSTSTAVTSAGSSTAYLEPALAVDPNGVVWVTYYGMSKSTGTLSLYAVHSSDGGAKWSPQSLITSAATTIPGGLYAASIGQFTGNAGTTAGDFATWMDCRTGLCSTSGNETNMVAEIEAVNVSAVNATVNLTMANADPTTFALPESVSWAIGTNQTLTAPSSVPHNATFVASFANYTGAVNSTSAHVTFDYTGGGSVVVSYTYEPAAYIAGTFSPNSTQARLTIDGTNIPLTGFTPTELHYDAPVAAGRTYLINASASNLYTDVFEHQVGVTSGGTTIFNVDLNKTVGWIAGHVTPANATLTLNGTPVAIDPSTGSYNVSAPWGYYNLSATGFGVTSSYRNVTVSPGQSTPESITLVGGYISGTLGAVYPGLSVSVDGVVVQNIKGATFNDTYLGGHHEVIATAPFYNTSWINVTVTPGRTQFVAITLTDTGTIVGQVTPLAAVTQGGATLVINNITSTRAGGHGGAEQISPATGDFSVTLIADQYYTVTVTATNYSTYTDKVFIGPGQTSAAISAALTPNAPPVQKGCAVTNTCPTNTSGGGSNLNTLLLVVGVIVVVVVIAAVAAVVMMRRRGGGGGSSSSPPEGSTGGTEANWSESGASDTYGGAPPAPPS